MKPRFATLISAGALSAGSLHAATIYSEDFFVNGASGLDPLNSVGWSAKGNGFSYPDSATALADGPVIGFGEGNEYLFQTTAAGTGPTLWWTDDVPDTPYLSLTNMAFDIGNNSDNEDIRVAIQSGGSWFVSNTVFNSVDGSFDSFDPQNLNFTTETWANLDFTTLAVGLPGLPQAGSVTDVGFFSADITDNVRIDNVVVIPEPGVAMLSLVALAGLVRRRR